MPKRRPDLPWKTESTRILRVPLVDWPALTQGRKRELRITGYGMGAATCIVPPSLLVAYSFERFRSEAKTALFVVEDVRKEPLGSISPESLEHEGFESLKEFRRYWREHRTRQAFKPLSIVCVLRLRPYVEEDRRMLADALLERLYGDLL